MLPWMREKFFGSKQKLVNIWNRRFDSENRSVALKKENMFVSDSDIFQSDHIRLSVISTQGGILSVKAASDFTIDKIKRMALTHFYSSSDITKITSTYKLVLVSDKRSLLNDNSIQQEGLKDNDEILIVECRQPCPKLPFSEESLKGPTDEDIIAATQNIVERNMHKLHPPIECTVDFQSEIRKILISLVEASARILTPSPNSDEVFALIRERLERKSKVSPNSQSLKQLTDMGFSDSQARKALRLNRMNESEALEWLLEHGSDTTDDETEMAAHLSEEANEAGPSRCPNKVAVAIDDTSNKPSQSVSQMVASLLESFRVFKRRDFQPNIKALRNLKDMGFEEDDIKEALRITGNNQSSACEWLIGDRRPSLEDLDTGLDPEGPIYKAIMANPAIQLSLTNPKMLLAFLSMLESPSSANMWINDPDAAPVLSQVFKTYHAEKHALQMNRYVEQQQTASKS